ncbi:MAG: Glutamine transport ATP-binding protein GlnQ [Pseudomonadota bacterium]|jgi:polar amino acid transport system ATP-binding protein
MIEIEELSKKYSGHYAVKNVSFKILKKETVAIVGPSGSGKSTLLRCINQLELPSSGNIYIDGKKLLPSSARSIRGKIGMVFQHFNLFPHMNVLENLTYAPMSVKGMNQEKAKTKAIEFLQRFNLNHKSHFMPHNLSGGQKQRVAIARALMMQPEIILFDEPTSALDPEVIGDVADVIASLKHEMISIVVTHHIRFAKAIADRIIFMDQGQILCDQTNEEFFQKPKSQRARLFLEKVGEF